MVQNIENIYENNDTLKAAIAHVLRLYKKTFENVLVVNVEYSEKKETKTLYSGIRYINNLRRKCRSSPPVLFYGFFSPEFFKGKKEASVLGNHLVSYLQVPFKIKDFYFEVERLKQKSKMTSPFDENDVDYEISEKIIDFRHEVKNTIGIVKLISKLKRDVSNQQKKEDWYYLKKLFNGEKNRIRVILNTFDLEFSGIIPIENFKLIKENLERIQQNYENVFELFKKYSRNDCIEVINTSEFVINLLNEVLINLEEVKND